jgi:acyl-CoA synthetase (AMP-forming)/AMP-acid ligase II
MAFRIEPGERLLIVAPLYHAGAAVAAFFCVAQGGSLYIQQDFMPTEVVWALSEERIAYALLVPAMIQACLVAVPEVAERRYPHLRCIGYSASPIAEHTLRRAVEVFKCEFIQAYGMTETTAGLTLLLPADHQRALTEKPELLLSAGRPLVGTELRVVDAHDCPLPNGTIGEIIARGPQLMQGYWHRPEETAEALRGGWMHTGDAGMLDEEGYVYIQDRVKDMLVSGGENIYPRVVEDVLFQHPAIADAAVIGVPDPQWGETVKAIVVLRQGATATGEEIIDFCRGKLGGFERPRSVDFVEALPRNPTGKVLKRVLREPYWVGHQRRVGGA